VENQKALNGITGIYVEKPSFIFAKMYMMHPRPIQSHNQTSSAFGFKALWQPSWVLLTCTFEVSTCPSLSFLCLCRNRPWKKIGHGPKVLCYLFSSGCSSVSFCVSQWTLGSLKQTWVSVSISGTGNTALSGRAKNTWKHFLRGWEY
jgi:hypothetical protein